MKVLVLSGANLTGPYIVRELASLGHSVTVFHRGETEAGHPVEVRHIHGNRANIDQYTDEFRRLAPDVVLDMMPLAVGRHAGRDAVSG